LWDQIRPTTLQHWLNWPTDLITGDFIFKAVVSGIVGKLLVIGASAAPPCVPAPQLQLRARQWQFACGCRFLTGTALVYASGLRSGMAVPSSLPSKYVCYTLNLWTCLGPSVLCELVRWATSRCFPRHGWGRKLTLTFQLHHECSESSGFASHVSG